MTVIEQIDYMIESLQIAKDEIEYADEYLNKKNSDENFYSYGHMGKEDRIPNGTVIRESLKMVGRMANIIANNVSLSPYCNKLFRNK